MRDILLPLRRLHGTMHEEQLRRNQSKNLAARIRSVPTDMPLFVMTPTHGNLGDHAIAEAISHMLQEMQLDYLEITSNELQLLAQYKRMGLLNGHPILVNGGGNLGTLWPGVEQLFRQIIQNAPRSPIVCLPNTIYYEDTPEGQQELQKSREIYNAHDRLLLCARERISYEYMKKNYKNVLLIPDMALSLNECSKPAKAALSDEKDSFRSSSEAGKREGCILCLRSDSERTRTEAETQILQEQAQMMFGMRVKESDMNINRPVPIAQRSKVLAEKYAEFRTAELVITDRLHGMIFAAITGTPCIVIDSKSPKVRGCYEWIRELGYIRFVDTPDQIAQAYEPMKGKNFIYHNESLVPYYQELREKIEAFFEGENCKFGKDGIEQ